MGKERRSKFFRRQVRLVEDQLRLPLVDALVDVRASVMDIVTTSGLKVIQAMLEEDRDRLCGPKHARRPERETVRGGTSPGEIVLGGRRVSIQKPRVRRVSGGEVVLPTYKTMNRSDALDERAVEQMVIGVATRKYERSLESLPEELETRGTSRSAVSRRFIARTRVELEAWQGRSLKDMHFVALMMDGIGFGEHTLVVALGIDASGKKHPLAMREGSTENGTLCSSLLSDLVARGLPCDRALLFVLDGGKGLHSAVRSVFGKYAVIQRCQVHKKRNVLDHLPTQVRDYTKKAMSDAYALSDVKKAKQKLEQLANALDEKYPGAASSLREGLDETLTVMGLGLSRQLRRSLETTNPIESMFDTVRQISARVTRWKTGKMVLRWALTGIREAEKGFQRLTGSKDMPKLLAALHDHEMKLAASEDKRAAA